jgi:hypothetical protein
MVIELNNDKILIELDASLFSLGELQQFTQYLKLIESNVKNQGTQEQVDELAREVNKNWWLANKRRYLKSLLSLRCLQSENSNHLLQRLVKC